MAHTYETDLGHIEIVATKLIHGLNLIEANRMQHPNERRRKSKEFLQSKLAKLVERGYEMERTEEQHLNEWLSRIDPDYALAGSNALQSWLDSEDN